MEYNYLLKIQNEDVLKNKLGLTDEPANALWKQIQSKNSNKIDFLTIFSIQIFIYFFHQFHQLLLTTN